MENRIIISETNKPAYNLGLEEYLIDSKDNILYLWQNDNTIVIGRNQNPYKECNLEKLREDEVNLVRRRSGGGAVFHDLGNLNFTIISKKMKNNIEDNFDFVNESLRELDIDSVFNGRNDLLVGDKKISGNAFFEDDDIFCHHGTLLIDVDMNRLASYLTASKLKLESKGINSVKSRVINLCEIKPELKVDDVIDVLVEEYRNKFDISEIEYFTEKDIRENEDIMAKVNRYLSWEWTYGESPESNLEYEEKFKWGIIDFRLNIVDGRVEDIKIYTDSIINDEFKLLEDRLRNSEFKREIFYEAVERTIINEEVKEDIKTTIDKFIG